MVCWMTEISCAKSLVEAPQPNNIKKINTEQNKIMLILLPIMPLVLKNEIYNSTSKVNVFFVNLDMGSDRRYLYAKIYFHFS